MDAEYFIVQYVYMCLVFFFGACIGSFCGVCMYRMPRSLNLVFSKSHCTKCGHSILWYDNIPIISCLILNARCRFCKTSYGFLHLLYELLFGFVAIFMWIYFDHLILSLYGFLLFSIVMILTDIDMRYKIIPDGLTVFGLIIGLIMLLLSYQFFYPWPVTISEALFGCILGFGFLWLISKSYSVIRQKDGLGFGDVKLMAWIGLHVGLFGVMKVLFVASLAGVLAWCVAKILYHYSKDDAIAFGPYLGFAFLVIWLAMFA